MKNMKNFALSIVALSTLVLTGCSSDNGVLPDEPQVENNELKGVLKADRTLDPSVQYKITGSYLVKNGAKLTIPAGTEIVSQVGTDRYIAIEQGSKIDVQGTSEKPVVMRSENNSAGDWGGLLLCGKATTTEGINVIAEVGGLIYGGTDDADNSGKIDYLVIRGAGAQINSESQYNGLTLYAVGSGTSISNVAIIDGADDGIEFFGGTVSATNLYFENNEDDSVDWTEGWSGTITNTYVLNNVAGFSTAIEADGDNSNPKIINFTAVNTGSPGNGIALQFKKQSGGTFSNILIQGYGTVVDMKDNGPLSNIIVDGAPVTTPDDTIFNGTPVDISGWKWVSK